MRVNWKGYTIGALLVGLALISAGCGGGGSDAPPAPKSTLTGKALKGYVKGGTVEVWSMTNKGLEGSLLASNAMAPTDATGAYSVDFNSTSDPVIVKIKGKAGAVYVDEVTGKEKEFGANDSFSAVVTSVTTGSYVAVTPITEVAARQLRVLATAGVTPGLLKTAITAANAETATRFGVRDILTPPGTTTGDDKKYTTMLTLISQVVNSQAAGGSATPLMDAINKVLVQAISPDEATRAKFGAAIATAITDVNTAKPGLLSPDVVAEVKAGVDTSLKITPTTDPTKIDTTPPTVPTNLAAPSPTSSAVALTWTASTDNVGVTGYDISRDGVKVGSSTTAGYTDATVAASKTYSYTVKAFDAAGNVSAASAALSVTTPAKTPEVTAPTAPTNLAKTSATISEVVLTWTASTDAVGVTGYDIYRDGSLIDSTTTALTYTDKTVAASKTYSYTVKAKNAAGKFSDASAALSVTTPDVTAPTAPTALAYTGGTSASLPVVLTWKASTDAVGVTGYDIYRGDSLLGSTTTELTYTDKTADYSKTYSYTVKAKNAAGKISDASVALSVKTEQNLNISVGGNVN